MPAQTVNVEIFLELAKTFPVFDVRSPGEYNHAHIPGAHSLPIFTDEQRKEIGTTYKQVSRQDAIRIGLSHFGVALNEHISKVEEVLKHYRSVPEKKILIHCWRGGMRSAAMAWLMNLYGFEVVLLKGGYKAYRNLVIRQFDWPFKLQILGGFTGSGKTETLIELSKLSHRVIDLEAIASHKGSAFGGLGMKEQPSQEHFENELVHELMKHYTVSMANEFLQESIIWLENESQRIGNVNLPVSFVRNMKSSPVVRLDIPFESRLDFICEHYSRFEKEKLVTTIMRLRKRLGGLNTQNAINFILENNIKESFRILLAYYDKFYTMSSADSEKPHAIISTEEVNPVKAAKMIHQTVTEKKYVGKD